MWIEAGRWDGSIRAQLPTKFSTALPTQVPSKASTKLPDKFTGYLGYGVQNGSGGIMAMARPFSFN